MIGMVLTAGNLLCGFTAILLVAAPALFGWPQPPLRLAVVCLAAAGLCDALDGPAARRGVPPPVPWGRSFDALADLISFGVAPAVLVGFWVGGQGRMMTIAVVTLFVLAGAWRLARHLWSAPLLGPGRFEGLPITAAGLSVAAFWLLHEEFVGYVAHPYVAYAGMIGLAALMVSRLPYDKFPVLFRGHPRQWVLGLAIVGAIAWRPEVLGPAAALLYLLHGPLRALAARRRTAAAPGE